MEKFAAAFKKVQKINKAIIGAVLLLMIGVVFLQTFCRFVIFMKDYRATYNKEPDMVGGTFQISVCGIDRSWNQPRGDRSPVCPH